MGQCLVCPSNVEPFISFGKMPIANGFLLPKDFRDEYFFELEVSICPQCAMVQLNQLVDPEKLFHQNYAFFSSTSSRMAEHFRRLAQIGLNQVAETEDPFIVEIGSNDGILLRHVADAGVRHLGIEPSENVAEAGRRNGVETRCSFFNQSTAAELLRECGPADIILAANVICHIPDLHSVMAGIKLLLKEKGIFIFEDPYLGDIVEKTSYDQFYDEHVFYFCFSSLSNLLDQYDMEIVDAEPQPVHGGSMRYVIAKKGAQTATPRLAALISREAGLGLSRISTFRELKSRIEESRDRLKSLLNSLKRDGKRVVGYGATSKSTTVTNYGDIGPELIEFISDTTPTKQGKFSPGTHIPVKHYDEFLACYPDYALLFAWNHGEEIMEKEQMFVESGGKWITFVPKVGIV